MTDINTRFEKVIWESTIWENYLDCMVDHKWMKSQIIKKEVWEIYIGNNKKKCLEVLRNSKKLQEFLERKIKNFIGYEEMKSLN